MRIRGKLKILVLTGLLSLLGFFQAGATHLMGGYVSYWPSKTTAGRVIVQFVIYRDASSSSNAALDPSFTYYIKGANSSTRTSRTETLVSKTTVTSNVNACASSYKIEKGVYLDSFLLGTDTTGYYIWYPRSARNLNITNVNTSGNNVGTTYYTFIPTKTYKNSSPTIVKDPVPIICANKTNIFNAGITDPDGDSLVYSFVKPYDDDGTFFNNPPNFSTVTYRSGYSVSYPFGTSSDPITIDAITGEIKAKPSSTGLYIITLQVKEYRVDPLTKKVRYMGLISLDLQYLVSNCTSNPAPSFYKDTSYKRTISVGEKLCLTIKAHDTAKYQGSYDSLKLTSTSVVYGTLTTFPKPWASWTDKKSDTVVSSEFCWTPSCDHITYTSPHIVTFRVEDKGCNLVEQSYSIYVKPVPFVKPPVMKCLDILSAGTVRLTWDTISYDKVFNGYHIYRKSGSDPSYTLVKTISNRLTNTWVDSSVTKAFDTSYSYYIRSANTCAAEGFTTDTFQTILIKTNKLGGGSTQFTWNQLSRNLRDSFVVLGDTGTGTKVFDTVTTRIYFFKSCLSNVSLQVIGLVKGASCLSHSNTKTADIRDTTRPVKGAIINATVKNLSRIDLTFSKSSSDDVSFYEVWRYTNGSGPSLLSKITATTAATYTYNDLSVSASSASFCYEVAAVDKCGNRAYFGKLHCPVLLKATSQQQKVKLSWQNYSGYTLNTVKLEKWNGSAWVTKKNLLITDTTYTDTGLTCKNYYYRITTTEKGGNSQTTYSDTVLAAPFDTVLPASPVIKYVSVKTDNTTETDFTPEKERDTRRYIVRRWLNDSAAYRNIDTVYTTAADYKYNDKKVSPDKYRACYWIVKQDSCGNLSKIAKTCAVELKTTAGELNAQLKWRPYSGGIVLKYYIEVATLGGSYSTIDSVLATDTSYLSKNLNCNQKYTYRIRTKLQSITDLVYSDTSNVKPFDTIPPGTPAIANVTVTSPTSVQISFSGSSDKDTKEYRIYSSTDGINYSWVGSVPHDASSTYSFSHSGITPYKKTYSYYIIAVDTCRLNASKASSVHRHIQLSGKAGEFSSHLKWEKYRGNTISKYYIQRLKSFSWVTIDSVSGTDSMYTDSNKLGCNIPYIYQVVGKTNSGLLTYSDTVIVVPFDTIPPKPVLIRYASVNDDNSSITIQFDTTATAVFYAIQSKKNSGSYTNIGLLGHQFTQPVTVVQSGINPLLDTFSYQVIASDTCGNVVYATTASTHTTMELKGVAGNKTSYLKWSPYKGYSIDKYYIQRKTGTTWVSIDSVSSSTTTYTDTKGLACNKYYFYRIIAAQSGGYKSRAQSDTIAVKPFDTVRPAKVNMYAVTVANRNSIDIKFDTVADQDLDHYEVYYRKGTSGTFTKVTDIPKPKNSPVVYRHTDITNLNTGSYVYSYQVKGVDSCAKNISLTSETHTSILLTGNAGNYSASIKWTKYAGWVGGVKNYIVELYTGGKWNTLATLTASDSVYSQSPLPCLTRYYRIKAVENGGDNYFSYSDSIAITPYDTVKPKAPVITYVSVTSPGKITINWTKSISNDVTRYRIYRRPGSGIWKPVATVLNVSSYVDNVNTSLGRYCYAVSSIDSCAFNESGLSSDQCEMYFLADSDRCSQKLFLNWTPYKGWPSGVKAYNIYKGEKGQKGGFLITMKPTDTAFVDSAISNKKTYCYRIEAVPNSGAFTSYSDSSCAKVYEIAIPRIYSASKTATGTTNGEITIKWKSVAGQRFYNYYRLYAKPEGGTYSLIQDKIPVQTDSFVYTGIDTRGKDYTFYLQIVDSCGNVTTSPEHKTINLDGTVGQLIHRLRWTAYKGFTVMNYYLERKEAGKFTTVDTLAGTDTLSVVFPAPCNYTIFYRVKAVDASGHFAYSDTIARKAIDTIPSNPVKFHNASVFNGSKVKIDFNGADSVDVFKYVIQRGVSGLWSTAGQVIFTKPNDVHSFTDAAANTLRDYNCYTIITLDSCLNATPSDTFCTIQLKGKPLNEANRLSWHPFKGYPIKTYHLFSYDTKNSSWKPLKDVKGTDTTFLHDSLHCYLAQNYRIIGEQNNGSYVTISDSIQLTPYDSITPPTSPLKYADIQPDHSIKLAWKYDPKMDVKYFEVWRKKNLGPFTKIATVIQDSFYIDKTVNTQTDTTTYYIITIDSCNTTHRSTPSDSDRTMLITASTGACVPLTRLNWTGYKDLPQKTDSFIVFRKKQRGSWTAVKSLPASRLSYVDSTVTESEWYCFRIKAVDYESGYSSFSDSVCSLPWVFPKPDTSRTIWSTVTATGTANGSVRLEWQRATLSDTFARGYHIYVTDKSTGLTVLADDVTDLNITSDTLKGLDTRNKLYSFNVRVYNLCVAEGQPGIEHQPVNLSITNNNMQIGLTWTAYVGSPVSGYDVLRSVDGNSFAKIAAFNMFGSSYTDTNLYCGHRYTYMVKARLPGYLSASDTEGVTAFDTIPPGIPQVYAATIDTTDKWAGKVSLSFLGGKAKNRSGFRIYRGLDGSPLQAYTDVLNTNTGLHYWQDTKENTIANIFSYAITALDSCGNESPISEKHSTIHLNAKSYNRYIALGWTHYEGWSAWRYIIEKKSPNKNWYILDTVSSSESSYVDSAVKCHVFYQYRIRGIETGTRWVSFSNSAGDTGIQSDPPIVGQIKRVSVEKTGSADGIVSIDWNASVSKDNSYYNIYRSTDGVSWKLVRTNYTNLNFIDSGLNTFGEAYSYKINAVDSCGNVSAAFSTPHTTVLFHGKPGNQRITLTWSSYAGWQVKEYRIYRNGKPYDIVSGSDLGFIDTLVLCINRYKYRIEAVSMDGTILSESNEDSIQAYDHINPAAVYITTASVYTPNNEVLISWKPSASFDVKNYYIFKRAGGTGNLEFLDSTQSTYYYEKRKADISTSDCYFVYARDYCGNTSDISNNACLIILNGKRGDQENFLTWNGYEHWNDGVAGYNVYKNEDSTGWVLLGRTRDTVMNYNDKSLGDNIFNYCYQVEAIEKPGVNNAVSRSTVICLHQDPIVLVPNSFSPGISAGLNDDFGPKGMFISSYVMQIYNRWGQLVYETTDSKPWDGTHMGALAEEGVYMYYITVKGYNYTSKHLSGTVTIIR